MTLMNAQKILTKIFGKAFGGLKIEN